MVFINTKIHAKSPHIIIAKYKNVGFALCGVFKYPVDITADSLSVTCRKCVYFLKKEGKFVKDLEPWSPGTKKKSE